MTLLKKICICHFEEDDLSDDEKSFFYIVIL